MTITANSVALTQAQKLQLNRDLLLTPINLSVNTTIDGAAHPFRNLFGTSAVAQTHTIGATGFTANDLVYGQNLGVGSMTFVGSGFTISSNATLFPSAIIVQGEPFCFRCDGATTWTRVS